MSKHTLIIFLGIFVIVLAVAGIPPWARTSFLVIAGLSFVILGYLSSVVYCSNCKKLIENTENLIEGQGAPTKEDSGASFS